MKISAIAVALAVAVGAVPAMAGNCFADSCSVGELVKVSTDKNDFPIGCPTQALSDYTTFILGLAQMQSMMGITIPKDPQKIEDQLQGESAEIDKSYRGAAGVSSVAEGLSACTVLKKGERVIVLKLPDPESTSMSAKVSPAKGGVPFWIAASELDKIK